MTETQVLKLFNKQGALLNGHFKLSSGLHSEKYLQCAPILQYPKLARRLSGELAKRFSKETIDAVVGPALGGITLAYEIARALGVRGIFAEREDGKMTLRRGFSINAGERVLVVEDVITTGGSTKEVIGVVKSLGGGVVGVASIIDRSGCRIDFGVRQESLARVDVKTFEPGDCPLCRSGTPLVKPGSKN